MPKNEEYARDILAKNIKKYRQVNDISQEDLAEELEVTTVYISQLENAKREKIYIDHLDILSDLFNISVSEIFKVD